MVWILEVNPTHRIGNWMSIIGQNIVNVFAEHSSLFNYGIQTRMSCPKIPLLKMTLGPADTGITPRIPETLLNGPRTGGLELLIFQASKQFLMLPPSHHNFWRGGLFLKQDICSIPQTALYSCYKKEAVFDILLPCPHLLSL